MVHSAVRVRFAPYPTGMFHVGNARSVLFNWVFARQSGGTMVLRIEDTDAARNRPEWVQGILDTMAWLGIGPGEYEGPVFQSAYAGEHRAAIARLLGAGLAYYCGCTPEQVIARTGSEHKGYDGYCRDRGRAAGPGTTAWRPGSGPDPRPACVVAGGCLPGPVTPRCGAGSPTGAAPHRPGSPPDHRCSCSGSETRPPTRSSA